MYPISWKCHWFLYQLRCLSWKFEKSVVAQRQVYDGIHHSGGVLKVDITKSKIKNVNISDSRYQEALKESRKKCSEAEKRNTKEISTNENQRIKSKESKVEWKCTAWFETNRWGNEVAKKKIEWWMVNS